MLYCRKQLNKKPRLLWRDLVLIMLALFMVLGWLTSTVYAANDVLTVTNCSNDTELKNRIDDGNNVIIFDCGNSVTLNISSVIDIGTKRVTIDGGGQVTLRGSGGHGIFQISSGRLVLQNIQVENGSATQGGAIYNNNGRVWVINSTIANNSCTASDEAGCGIYSTGGLARTYAISSTFTGNVSSNGWGGAIGNTNGLLEIVGSTFDSNQARFAGGAVSNTGGTLTIQNSIFNNNQVTSNSTTPRAGGALFVRNTGSTISHSTFSNNSAPRGGAITSFGDASKPTTTIENSTFNNNEGRGTTTTANVDFGPGGLDLSNGVYQIINSTISGNRGTSPGAIFVDASAGSEADVQLTNSTVSDNISTDGNVGGIQRQGGGSLTLKNSIISGNTPKTCNLTDIAVEAGSSNNMGAATDDCAGAIIIKDPNLEGLDNRGGLTEVDPIPSTSADPDENPARDAGSNANCPTTDQRGYSRSDGSCDIGAYEANGTAPNAATINNTTFITPGIAGGPVYILTVEGTDFNASSMVMWNGMELPTHYDGDSTELTAYVPVEWMLDAGVVPITVEDSEGQSSNSFDLVVDATKIPPNAVTISGPTSSLANDIQTFTAVVTPTTSATPLQYVWQATDQAIFTFTNISTIVNEYDAIWNSAGTKYITVTASNQYGQAIGYYNTVIKAPIPNDGSITINGPNIGKLGQNYTFTATIPSGVTTPISYTWEATDQNPTTISTNSLNPESPAWSWLTEATQYITLTIDNGVGNPVVLSHQIDVLATPITVQLVGSSNGFTNTTYTFEATVTDPVTVTRPMTFTWEATNHPEQVFQVNSLNHTQVYSWTTGGVKLVTVTVKPIEGKGSATHQILIYAPATDLAIDGPTAGIPNETYSFTATTTLSDDVPVTYTWTIDGHSGTQIGQTITTTWPTTGSKQLTVVAENRAGTKSATHTILLQMPPTMVSIDGPTVGGINYDYTFSAVVNASAARPLSYTWEAEGQTPTTGEIVSFNWGTTGTKTIILTVSNVAGTQVANHAITLDILPDMVSLTGPTAGSAEERYEFTASVTPTNTQQPIIYSWHATEQTTISQTNGLSNTIPFTWTVDGLKAVTVTVDNGLGMIMTATHLITIESGDKIAPLTVMINGPTAGGADKNYTFTASISPTNVSQPLTLTWQATGGNKVIQRFEGDTPARQANQYMAVFSWPTTGTKHITLTAQNSYGEATGFYTTTLYITADNLIINAPTQGQTNLTYVLTSTIKPITTTEPITYTWWIEGEAEPIQSPVLSYTWSLTGTYVITLVATNPGGSLTATHIIEVALNQPKIFLPMVIKP